MQAMCEPASTNTKASATTPATHHDSLLPDNVREVAAMGTMDNIGKTSEDEGMGAQGRKEGLEEMSDMLMSLSNVSQEPRSSTEQGRKRREAIRRGKMKTSHAVHDGATEGGAFSPLRRDDSTRDSGYYSRQTRSSISASSATSLISPFPSSDDASRDKEDPASSEANVLAQKYSWATTRYKQPYQPSPGTPEPGPSTRCPSEGSVPHTYADGVGSVKEEKSSSLGDVIHRLWRVIWGLAVKNEELATLRKELRAALQGTGTVKDVANNGNHGNSRNKRRFHFLSSSNTINSVRSWNQTAPISELAGTCDSLKPLLEALVTVLESKSSSQTQHPQSSQSTTRHQTPSSSSSSSAGPTPRIHRLQTYLTTLETTTSDLEWFCTEHLDPQIQHLSLLGKRDLLEPCVMKMAVETGVVRRAEQLRFRLDSLKERCVGMTRGFREKGAAADGGGGDGGGDLESEFGGWVLNSTTMTGAVEEEEEEDWPVDDDDDDDDDGMAVTVDDARFGDRKACFWLQQQRRRGSDESTILDEEPERPFGNPHLRRLMGLEPLGIE